MLDHVLSALERELQREPLAAGIQRHGPCDSTQSTILAAALEPFLLGMYEGLAFAMRASRDVRAGRAVTFANGQVLHYVLDDRDLFPESTYGALGWLDDALLVHRHAAQLIVTFPWLASVVAPYAAPSPQALEIVRTLLPAGVADAIERTSRNLLLVATTLVGVARFEHSEEATPVAPVLRLSDACALL